MARTLDQIMKEIDSGYAGSRNTIQGQINALPGETQSQLDGLQAQAQQAHTDILDGTRRRGLGFSGIPIGEQVRYDSTTFKPAVAGLYSSQNARKTSLEEALNSLFRDQRTQALGVRESELGRELQLKQLAEQQRQFDLNLAWQKKQAEIQRAAQVAASSYFGGGGGAPANQKVGAARIERTAKGGFNFFDAAGRPVNAAQYAQMTGTEYRKLLSDMAKAGDANAKIALQFVGNDGKFWQAPEQYRSALQAVGASGNYIKTVTQQATNYNAPLSARMGL